MRSTNTSSVKKIFIAGVFVMILLVPISNRLFGIFSDSESAENRALAEMPDFDLSDPDPFPSEYERFYNDHFFMRNRINNLWSYINRNIFRKSPVDKAMIGMNGWLYLKQEESETYLGRNLFSTDEMAKFKAEITRRSRHLDSIGCKYYFVVAPTKYSVYPEYLPPVYRLSKQTNRTDQIVEAVSEIKGVEVIDLRKALLQNKDHGRLYLKSDNHWNDLGAYYAYREMINRIRSDFPSIAPAYPLDSFNVEMKEVPGGNIAQMINAKDEYAEQVPHLQFKHQKIFDAPKAGYKPTGMFAFDNIYEMPYVGQSDQKINVLVIRDSFGQAIMPLLPAHFSKTIFIFDEWMHMFNKSIVDQEKPDIYIQLTLECFYQNMLEFGDR